ncbi:cupin domain-containing protein [Fusibacter bizertensis]
MKKINISAKMGLFSDVWSPKIIGEVNDSYVKAAKLKGEFVWHSHAEEDEMFMVIKGQLTILYKDNKDIGNEDQNLEVILNEGEFIIIPKGVEHMPVAKEEVEVLLFESKTTRNTGEVTNEKTVENLERI